MGDWTKFTDKNDKNAERTGTQRSTVIQTVHFILSTLYPRKECTTQPGQIVSTQREKQTKQLRTSERGS